MNEVFLLGHTAIDWSVFSQACTAELGFDPLPIMAKSIYKKSMPTFVGLMGLDGTMDNWSRDTSWKHVNVTFITIVDDALLKEIVNCGRFNYTIKQGVSGSVVIVTGNLLDWHDFVIEGCAEKVTFSHRQFTNKLYSIFIRNKYEQIFNKYKQTIMTDSTFTLELR